MNRKSCARIWILISVNFSAVAVTTSSSGLRSDIVQLLTHTFRDSVVQLDGYTPDGGLFRNEVHDYASLLNELGTPRILSFSWTQIVSKANSYTYQSALPQWFPAC